MQRGNKRDNTVCLIPIEIENYMQEVSLTTNKWKKKQHKIIHTYKHQGSNTQSPKQIPKTKTEHYAKSK